MASSQPPQGSIPSEEQSGGRLVLIAFVACAALMLSCGFLSWLGRLLGL